MLLSTLEMRENCRPSALAPCAQPCCQLLCAKQGTGQFMSEKQVKGTGKRICSDFEGTLSNSSDQICPTARLFLKPHFTAESPNALTGNHSTRRRYIQKRKCNRCMPPCHADKSNQLVLHYPCYNTLILSEKTSYGRTCFYR